MIKKLVEEYSDKADRYDLENFASDLEVKILDIIDSILIYEMDQTFSEKVLKEYYRERDFRDKHD